MKIINFEDIKNIVYAKARYQKVMLLTDENSSVDLVAKIYQEVKDFCIFNKCNITKLDNEIFNGYRIVIYLVSAQNYLNCNINKSEFINVIIAQQTSLLPYFLDKSCGIEKQENYLTLMHNGLDLNMLSSIYFNAFYNYFQNLTTGQSIDEFFSLAREEITQQNLFKVLERLDKNFVFLDMAIIKQSNVSLSSVGIMDLILINAFITLICNIKQQNLMLVDTYKAAREDMALTEKFYRQHFNQTFHQLVILNYNCLINFANKTKEKILEILSFSKQNKDDVNLLISEVKNYSKFNEDACGYLYLYNLFGL